MGVSAGHHMGPEQKCQYLGDRWADFFETWYEYSRGVCASRNAHRASRKVRCAMLRSARS